MFLKNCVNFFIYISKNQIILNVSFALINNEKIWIFYKKNFYLILFSCWISLSKLAKFSKCLVVKIYYFLLLLEHSYHLQKMASGILLKRYEINNHRHEKQNENQDMCENNIIHRRRKTNDAWQSLSKLHH